MSINERADRCVTLGDERAAVEQPTRGEQDLDRRRVERDSLDPLRGR